MAEIKATSELQGLSVPSVHMQLVQLQIEPLTS